MVRQGLERVRGQEADGLGHGRLEQACVGGVDVPVDGDDLAQGEVGGQELVGKANVVRAEAPAEVPGLEGEPQGEDAPYYRVVEAGSV